MNSRTQLNRLDRVRNQKRTADKDAERTESYGGVAERLAAGSSRQRIPIELFPAMHLGTQPAKATELPERRLVQTKKPMLIALYRTREEIRKAGVVDKKLPELMHRLLAVWLHWFSKFPPDAVLYDRPPVRQPGSNAARVLSNAFVGRWDDRRHFLKKCESTCCWKLVGDDAAT